MHKTIRTTQAAIFNREVGVEELVKSRLEVVAAKNKNLNVFITTDEENALKTAQKLDNLLRKDIDQAKRQPLFGVPVGFKDIFLTKGVRTTAGAKLLENYVPPYSATVVDKLSQAGVVSLGKLNCDAWAHGSSGENSDFGSTKNPHNPDYVAGGSSSGSAAAVAAGMILAATATDTGGSIRLPASFTGTVGFKPTYGRVSRYGVIAMASSLDSIGHVTGCVEDAAIVFQATSGVGPLDAMTADSRPFSLPDFSVSNLKGKKIGIPQEYVSGISDEAVKKNFAAVLKKLENLGAVLVEVTLPHTETAVAIYYVIQPAEVSSNLARFDGVRFGASRDRFSAEAIRRMMIGTYTLSAGYYDAYYKTATKARTLIRQDFQSAFSQVDLLISPVSATPAFKLGEKTADPLAMYLSDALTIPVNLAGLPAIALPTGKTKDNLPLGIQLIANRYQEETLFPVAYELEQAI